MSALKTRPARRPLRSPRPLLSTLSCVLALSLGSACTTSESHRVVETQSVETYKSDYSGPRETLSIGRFSNNSPYMQGLFSEGDDRLGNQARTILKTHLSQTNRFDLLDRENLQALAQESSLAGQEQQLLGASLVVTGQVTEFGRRTTGDKQLFGLLGRGKEQTAYSKVSINIVEVKTSRVVWSVQGAGEYSLDDREVLGTGTRSGYDSTLNGKVLNLAITDAVNKLVRDLESGAWKPSAQ